MTGGRGCSGIIIPQGLDYSRTCRIDQLEDRDGLDDDDDVRRRIICIIARSVALMKFAASLGMSVMEVLVVMVVVVVVGVDVGVGWRIYAA